MQEIQILSFFTGGGFLDIGFERAGFQVEWTNENNPVIADLYASGMAAWRSSVLGTKVSSSISERRSISELSAGDVIRSAFGKKPPLFGVIGGPPCTDFSRGGLNGGHRGDHGKLMQVFVDLICDLNPTFFLIENVAGLRQTHKHRKHLNGIIEQLEIDGDYGVDSTLLNALDLGVPQDRDRLFIVGFRKSLIRPCMGRRLLPGERGWFTWPHDERYSGAKHRYPWPRTAKFGSKVTLPSGIPIELTVQSVLESDPEAMPNGREYFNPQSKKFTTRDEGDVAFKSFKRLHRFRFSPTAWYGNNEVHLHPWKARRLSVREAMRLQTVPDEYVLPAEVPLSPKFKMVCNGVPCKMAERVAMAIKDFLSPALTKPEHSKRLMPSCQKSA